MNYKPSYFLDDSLAKLMLKKKRQTVKRFYRSGTLDSENITACLTSKNIFTRISGDNRRGECHILLDCSGSTYHQVNRDECGDDDYKEITRLHLIMASGMQMARYLSRFFKVKMTFFKHDVLPMFEIPKGILPEQFADFIVGIIEGAERGSTHRRTEQLLRFLKLDQRHAVKIDNFLNDCANDAPNAIKESIKIVERNHSKSLIVAICDGDPYATYEQDNINKMKNFQKKHEVVFSVIDGKNSIESQMEDVRKFENEHGIKTATTTDGGALETGGGMLINNTLLKILESLNN